MLYWLYKFLVRIVPIKLTSDTAGVENMTAGPETATVEAAPLTMVPSRLLLQPLGGLLKN
jgi:hypothetical protein